MQVQVRVNEKGALRNQRYAFADRFTLVSELLQNARRAGATAVEIEHDQSAEILRVRDDGQGISDFQKLLIFNESGWDDAVAEVEHPFGIGFSKCLYSAKRCIVRSRGQQLDFLTADALAQQLLDVQACDGAEIGTEIELHGVDLLGLADRLKTICCGFALPVSYNGSDVPRPHAQDALAMEDTPVGQIFLAEPKQRQAVDATFVYLQGFLVTKLPSYTLRDWSEVNVVHLDPQAFIARLPDRSALLDEDKQVPRIQLAITQAWRQSLLRYKQRWEAEHFISTFYETMKFFGHLDLLNDMDALPVGLCRRITGYPCHSQDASWISQLLDNTHVTREEVVSGRVTLVALGAPDESNFAQWMLAKAKGWLACRNADVHQYHWIQPHVRELWLDFCTVEAVGVEQRAHLEGRWAWTEVVLCQSIRISVGSDSAEIFDEGLFHANVLYIPGAENSGMAVYQASSFVDEYDHYREADAEADSESLQKLILRLRACDPVQTLRSLLEEIQLERYPHLRGRSFQLTVGDRPSKHRVEALAS